MTKMKENKRPRPWIDVMNRIGDGDSNVNVHYVAIRPVGWQLLLKPHKGPNKKGSIILTDETKEMNRVASTVARVAAIGPDAYADPIKFPNGPWCKVGDWVIIGKLAGARFAYDGEEFRFIDDDKILGVTNEPDNVGRVM